MAFMKKDLNFGLFILIIATLICFLVFTTYFQDRFDKLSGNYNEKIDEMEKLATKLNLEKARLNETSFELVKTVQKAEDLSGKYGGLKDEKEMLDAEIAKLTVELNQKKAKLTETELALTKSQATLQNTQEELVRSKADLRNCNSDLDDYREDYSSCCSELEILGGTC